MLDLDLLRTLVHYEWLANANIDMLTLYLRCYHADNPSSSLCCYNPTSNREHYYFRPSARFRRLSVTLTFSGFVNVDE